MKNLLSFVFLLIVIGAWNQGKSHDAAETPKSEPVAVVKKEPDPPKPPPPTPLPGEEVSKEFFQYIYPLMSYDCMEEIKGFVKYEIRAPGLMWGTNTSSSATFLLRYSRWSKKVTPNNTILIAGDEAEAQNGFGNWVKVRYTRTIDVVNKQVRHATLENGRLP